MINISSDVAATQAALRRFPREVKADLPRAVKEAAEPVRARAQTLAPWRTGALAGSIRIVGSGTAKVAVRAGGPSTFYARFQEYGTKYMQANPYLRPAVEEKGESVVKKIHELLQRTIGRVFGGG